MGRNIAWPTNELPLTSFNTTVNITHACFTTYRGYNSVQKELVKRFVADANGKIKKGTNRRATYERQAYAPGDYVLHETVILEPGDFIVMSLREQDENYQCFCCASVVKVTEELLEDVKKLQKPTYCQIPYEVWKEVDIDIDNFYSNIPSSAWKDDVPVILHKAIKEAFKVPERIMKEKD